MSDQPQQKPGFGSPGHLLALQQVLKITKAGYAGVMPSGTIVDRREFPNATPIPENSFMGIPKPKSVQQSDTTTPQPSSPELPEAPEAPAASAGGMLAASA